MKKIISLLITMCLALSVTVSMAALSGDTFTADSPSFKVETNSTEAGAKTGDAWYWDRLKDGVISTEDNKITETYAIYSILPAKGFSAWITADLGAEYQFSGVRLYSRLGWAAQAVSKGYIYVSDDGVDWMRSDLQTFNKNERYADFKTVFGGKEVNVNVRYIKVEAVQVGGADNQQHWGMEELELIKAKSGEKAVKASELSEFKADVSDEKETTSSSSGSTSSSSSSEGGILDTASVKFTMETDSTDSKATVGNAWYWDLLKDGVISTADNKITETYAQYSIHPDKNESAWVIADLGEDMTISGARVYGRFGWTAQCVSQGYIYVSDDGVDWMRADAQTFDHNARYADFKTVFGGKQMNVTARYIKIEAVQVGGKDDQQHWGMEEIQFRAPTSGAESVKVSALSEYKAEGKAPVVKDNTKADNTDNSSKYPLLTDKSSWQLSVNSQISEWNGVKAAFDGNKDTFWHSNYTAENGQVTWKEAPPYEINIVFPEKTKISGMIYQPRSSIGGTITVCEIWVSDSDSGELSLLTTANMSNDTTVKNVEFYANIAVKRIMLKATETINNVGTAAEFDFIAEREGLKDASIEEYPEIEAENKLYLIDNKYFTATSDVPVWAGHDVSSMFDSGINSFWQTEGTTFPIIFNIDMKTQQEITKMEMVPRQSSDFHGNWKSYEIWAGNSPDELVKVYEETDSPKSLDAKIVEFSEPIKARYLEFKVTSTHVLNVASMAEIYMYQTKDAMDRAQAQNYEKYVLKVDDKKMTVTKGSETYEKELDVAPYIYPGKGTTLIPLRGLIEEMGGEIEWIDETREINITAPSGRIEMQVQKKTVYSEHPNYGMIRYTLSVAPKIKDSRTFIPLRFVSEHMGYEVTWNGDTREITIEKK